MARSQWYMLNVVALVAITVAAVCIGFALDDKRTRTRTHTHILRALEKKALKLGAPESGLRVVLGYNLCVDVVARGRDVVPNAAAGARDHAFLRTDEQLREAYTYFFSQGAAAERACEPDVFATALAQPFLSGTLPGKRALGGNAALMARKMARVRDALRANVSVTVVGQIGAETAALLPSSVERVSSAGAKDELHFILEYSKGESLRDASGGPGVSSPRANRFIVTADTSTHTHTAMTDGITAADDADADVLVVAGLHMYEPLPANVREGNLRSIGDALSSRSGRYTVHLELASTADVAFMQSIVRFVMPFVDSVGFNEQEATALYEALGGRFGKPGTPHTRESITGVAANANDVARVLRFFFEAIPTLSRLHFHALPFHIVAHARTGRAGRGSADGKWKSEQASVAAGAVAATTDACGRDTRAVHDAEVSILTSLDVDTLDPRAADTHTHNFPIDSWFPVAVWSWPLDREANTTATFAFAPVCVCASPVSTVGLGDSISAAGLIADAKRHAHR